jgi:glycerol-3-phosphate acyltransferase PlsX
VLLDVGATTSGSVGAFEQFAIAGQAFAVAVGVSNPRIGLLTIGSESGKGDELRVEADAHLASSLPMRGLHYVGPVEGFDVTRGNRAQVIVTDGFTGNIVLKSIEGAAAWAAHQIGVAYGDSGPARGVIRTAAAGDFAGGLLLGVEGVTVVGHGAGTAAQVIGCVELARRAVDQNLIGNIRSAMADL